MSACRRSHGQICRPRCVSQHLEANQGACPRLPTSDGKRPLLPEAVVGTARNGQGETCLTAARVQGASTLMNRRSLETGGNACLPFRTHLHEHPLGTTVDSESSCRPSARLLAEPCSRRLNSGAGYCRPRTHEVIASRRQPTLIQASARRARKRASIPTGPGCECVDRISRILSFLPSTYLHVDTTSKRRLPYQRYAVATSQ